MTLGGRIPTGARSALAQAARLARGVRPVIRLYRAGLFDRDWYASQVGGVPRFAPAAAVHFLFLSVRGDVAPHPLVEPTWIAEGRARPGAPGLGALRIFVGLLGAAGERAGHPLLDPGSWVGSHPEAARHRGGAVGHLAAQAASDSPLPAPGALTALGFPAATLDDLRAVVQAPLPHADAVRADLAAQGDAAPDDGVSVVLVARDGWWPAWQSIVSVLAEPEAVAEVVVGVPLDLDPAARRILAVWGLHPRVRLVAVPAGSVAPEAAAACRCSRILLSAAGVHLWAGSAGVLREALGDDVAAACPVVVGPDGLVASAGVVATPDGSCGLHLLAGLGVEDARRAGDVLTVAGPTLQARMVWAADLHEDVDDVRRVVVATGAVAEVLRPPWLGAVRACAARPAAVRGRLSPTEPAPRPAGARGAAGGQAWATAGFALVAVDDALERDLRPCPASSTGWAVTRTTPSASDPRRWSIKIASPVGPRALGWGDTHFARALAEALTRLGLEVVVDHRPAARKPAEVHDDVVLVLRGLDPVVPPEGAVAVLWVISHPETVTAEELARYDVVFAASEAWAREATAKGWGPPGLGVQPLLQATDPRRFTPDAAAADTGEAVLFVGNSRSVRRPVVQDLLDAGVDVALFGRWDGFASPRHVRAPYLPNDDVPAAYASAGVVLNDHWPDMRAAGFVSNRLFDAAACGARVVSDRVEGVDALFGGLVRTFDTAAELVDLVRGAPDGWPDGEERAAIAHRVRVEHSFDARAARLLEAATRVRGSRPGGGVSG